MRPVFVLALAGWTLAVFLSFAFMAWRDRQAELQTAEAVALDNFNKDLLIRRWAATQGGVYVPASPDVPPNPYLADIPERDLQTPSGRSLTLVNPAYMTRLIHEMSRTQYGIRAHITSLDPIRPENAPDGWRRMRCGPSRRALPSGFPWKPWRTAPTCGSCSPW